MAKAPEAAAPESTSKWAKAKKFIAVSFGSMISIAVLLAVVAVIAFGIYRAFFVCAVENYEYAFKYNWWTGEVTRVEHPGWMTVYPFVVVGHTIDGRPRQVCINANSRVLNCKLVRFDPKGLGLFIEWHGRSAGDNPENLFEILKSYAYDGTPDGTYPFLKIDRQLDMKGPTK